jgi:hypothetical protein
MNHRPEPVFSERDLEIVRAAVGVAEDRVSDFYKLSASQWLRYRYDVRTRVDLAPDEIVRGPFAQVIRYEARPANAHLGSSAYDFYRICLQDHAILTALAETPGISLRPFALYIVAHELVHVVRFCKFLQNFDASPEEKRIEEGRVHRWTREILAPLRIDGMARVLDFFLLAGENETPMETLR